jgi:hypothetical protein
MIDHGPDIEASQHSLPLGVDDALPTDDAPPASEDAVTAPERRAATAAEVDAIPRANVDDEGDAGAGGFDYNKELIAPDLADDLRATAITIQKVAADAHIAIGRELLRIKDKLEHGQFLRWVKDGVGISISTAERSMRAAEWAETKSSIVTNLKPALLQVLSAKSTPGSIQKSVLERIEAGKKVTAVSVLWEVRQHKEAAARRRRAISPARPQAVEG